MGVDWIIETPLSTTRNNSTAAQTTASGMTLQLNQPSRWWDLLPNYCKIRLSGLTVVLSPAVPSDYVHLRVVSLLSAVNSDQDVLEDAGRVDVCPRYVGHQGCSPGLRAHLQTPPLPPERAGCRGQPRVSSPQTPARSPQRAALLRGPCCCAGDLKGAAWARYSWERFLRRRPPSAMQRQQGNKDFRFTAFRVKVVKRALNPCFSFSLLTYYGVI